MTAHVHDGEIPRKVGGSRSRIGVGISRCCQSSRSDGSQELLILSGELLYLSTEALMMCSHRLNLRNEQLVVLSEQRKPGFEGLLSGWHEILHDWWVVCRIRGMCRIPEG